MYVGKDIVCILTLRDFILTLLPWVQVEKLRTATVPVKRGESDILESEDHLKTDQPKKKEEG